MLDQQIIAYELKKALIAALPEVLAAAMKPAEKIKDIRIIDMGQGAISGLNGQGAGGGNGNGNGVPGGLPGGAGGGTLPDNIVSALMAYRMQAPLVDELMTELGFDPKDGLGAMWPKLAAEADKPAATDGAAAKTKKVEKPAAKPKPDPQVH